MDDVDIAYEASRYAERIAKANAVYNPDVKLLISEAFEAGAKHVVTSMPLSERMTEREKERIKTTHRIYGFKASHGLGYEASEAIVKMQTMESIFGKELFNAEDQKLKKRYL